MDLFSKTCGSVLKGQKVITLDSQAPLEDSCQILAENKILSAPVFDKSTQQFIGIFDYATLISYIFDVFESPEYQKLKNEEEGVPSTLEVKDLIRSAMLKQNVPVGVVSHFSKQNAFVKLEFEAKLSEAIKLFANGTHRVCVLSGNELVGILSQSTVLSLIGTVEHLQKLASIVSIPLEEIESLKLNDSTRLITVEVDENVVNAVALMKKHHISSVAVVAKDGRLFGNFSMTDLKHIMKNRSYRLLWQSCSHFVGLARRRKAMEDHGDTSFPVFDVKKTSTLDYAIRKLVAVKAHRLWVVDENDRPVGVVSLTDIMKILSKSLK